MCWRIREQSCRFDDGRAEGNDQSSWVDDFGTEEPQQPCWAYNVRTAGLDHGSWGHDGWTKEHEHSFIRVEDDGTKGIERGCWGQDGWTAGPAYSTTDNTGDSTLKMRLIPEQLTVK